MKFNRDQENYQQWLHHPQLDSDIKAELLTASDQDLQLAFGDLELEFGTAGIRGIMGPGPGLFNRYTIKKVTIALATYLRDHYPHQLYRGVVIGHDNRHHSKEFAQLVAEILTSFQIPAYLFKNNQMMPTPIVSFATKKLAAVAGIVITASHNPAIYNGYKIYDPSGTQLADEVTVEIAKRMHELPNILAWTFSPQKSLIKTIPNSIFNSYSQMIKKLQFYPRATKSKHNLKVVYSGCNGTGNLFTPHFLSEFGYQVIDVPEHQFEDPDFKNVGNPNPEFSPVWELPLKYAQDHNADIVIINDPDADRIGLAVNDGNNHFVRLNGNETGPLLIDWKLSQQKIRHRLPLHPALYSSFVTSNLGDRIAEETYGAQVIKTLTGFKWMGAEINREAERNLNFVFAYEESFGYVLDEATRDKDGIQAAVVLAEMAWFHKVKRDQTLLDYLNQLYQSYGYYYTTTLNYNVKPEEKKLILDPLMARLRQNTYRELGNLPVEKVEDYKDGLCNMPGQNLLKFYFEDGSWIAIRPSGTEPKLKIYFVIVDKNEMLAKLKYEKLLTALSQDLKIF